MPTSRSHALLILSAAAAATVSACGSSSSATSSASSGGSAAPSACSLLTTNEINSATHSTFSAGKLETTQQTPYGNYTVCVWTDQKQPLNTVRVSVWDKESAFNAGRTTATDVKDSTGVGSKSFTASFASVYAVAAGHTLFVQYYSPDGTDAEHLPISTSLAKTASARL